MREARCIILSLRLLEVMQASWFEVEIKEKRGLVSGTGAVRSKEWKANVEQSRDPGMRGTGTVRVVSPAWRVYFL